MWKKAVLLAVVAMALAAPPAALGAGGAILDIETGNTPGEGTQIDVSGTLSFVTAVGGFSGCSGHSTITIIGVSVSSFTFHLINITTGSCKGSGAFSNCTLESAEGSWEGDLNEHDLALKNVFINGTANAACGSLIGFPGALENVDFKFEQITLTPEAESGTSLDNLTLSGSGVAVTALGNISASASGVIGATEKGTWVIETI